MDILKQLGDGLSFEIYKQLEINTPVIFCTAYDEYALEAFKANGIDYILKPYSQNSIAEALKQSMEALSQPPGSSILVHHKDKIIPLKLNDIALAYIRNESVYLRTYDGVNYAISKSLDELDQLLGNCSDTPTVQN
ncbi:hypothetical protein ANCCEY_14877 [Ancylostoma ceylanicum]|uniref:Response regulatory domain-containing protein n=1 Tax=Ancylostoma ceylanicum TaxID=53326 RepID=A0A0D6L4S6_9BILA|nr:hypothetical protein ANCCEY_14877 [Ancylostoma ceylanicum]